VGIEVKVHVIALSAFLLAAPAIAQPSSPAAGGEGASSPSPAPANASEAGDHPRSEPRQICRRIDSDVSRRIGSRLVCHTEQEWRALQAAS